MAATLVTVTIVLEQAAASAPSFDVILLAAATGIAGPRVRSYSSLSEAEADGITALALPWVHRLLSVYFGQQPRPSRILIGRRDNLVTQSVSIVPTVFGAGYVYEIDIEGQTASYTVQALDGLPEIITGLVAAIDALSPGVPVDATDVGPGTSLTVSCTTPGRVLSIVADPLVYALTDLTTDPGIAADLSAMRLEPLGETAGIIVLDGNSRAEVEAASAWAQTRTLILVAEGHEGEVSDVAVTDDMFTTLRDLGHGRTGLIYTHQRVGLGYSAGWPSQQVASHEPGAATWANKRVSGVSAYDLTSSQLATIKAKRGTSYVTIAGSPQTYGGYVSTEPADYLDGRRGRDWLAARIRQLAEGILKSQPKVQYSATGLETIASAVRQALQEGVARGYLAATNPEPTVTVPELTSLDPTDIAERLLRGITLRAREAGAVHEIDITGTLTIATE